MQERIMLVEDEMIVAMDIRQRLEALGYVVVAHATNGEDAIRLSKQTSPNLILMDIKIRGAIDGIETASKIRHDQDIPIIYVTAFADETTLQRARVTEAFGYLIKPFEDRELRSAIEIALYKHVTDKKLRESEERFELAARAGNDGIWDWNLLTDQIYFSPRWKNLLGIEEQEPVSSIQDWITRVHPDDVQHLNQTLASHLEGIIPTMECEYRMLHRDGGYRWMLCRGLALFDAEKKPYRIAGSQSDITTRKMYEEQLTHRALHDELTQLPNRSLFIDRLRMVLENTHRSKTRTAAVLFLDIDHFKIINDSLGHVSGDEMLILFSQRLKQCVRLGDTVARFGGDEFAILVNGITTDHEAVQIAERICNEMHKPFSIKGNDIFNSASIGIVFITCEYSSYEDLLRDVDIAMYHAKTNGRGRYELFTQSMHQYSIERLQQEAEIRRALQHDEFLLHYQPIYSLESLQLVGFEALIRWNHPIRGLLLPGEFIHVAEESGLIIPIGEWVLMTATRQAKAWQLACGRNLKMSVNISALQFNDRNLVDMVQSSLRESGFDPASLELELTESVAMRNIQSTLEILDQFRAMGISIAIDDFGSGYSSLDHIRFLPTNSLKIDRSFIHDMKFDDSAIVSAIITMAHKLQLKVIAEGVESNDQLAMLKDVHCDQVQGFYLGKGLAPEQIWTLLLKSETNQPKALR